MNIKNAFDRLNRRLNTPKVRINEFEDISIKMTQQKHKEKNTGEKEKKTFESFEAHQSNICGNICIVDLYR